MNGPAVLAQIGKPDACAMWRVFQPFAALQRQGYPAEWDYKEAHGDGMTQYAHGILLAAVASEFDAVILPRQHWGLEDRGAEDNWFRSLHNAGKAVIFEVDDDMFSDGFIRRLLTLHKFTPEAAEARRASVIETMRRCDGVTVSSQRLATTVRQLVDGKPVVVVPNYMDITWFRAVQRIEARRIPPPVIGWAGGQRPDRDVIEMAEAWRRIAARFPQVRFVVQGYQPDVITQAVPAERLTLFPWLEIEAYPLPLRNIDIGCCPLSDSQFNRCKTPIKAYEYAVSRAAVVASPLLYGQVVEHGKDGYICQTADEWEQALAELVSNEERRREMAKRLYRKVADNYSLNGNVWRWPAAWAEIVAHFRAHRPVLVPVRAGTMRPVAAGGGRC